MSKIQVNGVRLNYEETGAGPETIVFAHGLMMNYEMYRAQVKDLAGDYRCIAYDHRGQGGSEVSADGYDMDNLALDAAELIQALGAAPCHFVGLSMGGFVGLRLALHYPGLLRSLTLLETSADSEPATTRRKYRTMIAIARWLGFRPLTGSVMKIMFGRGFLQDPARLAEREEWKQRILSTERQGVLRAARAAVHRDGVSAQLGNISVPTLVIVGEEDLATPPLQAERMREGITGARLAILPAAGHSSTIEQPAAVTAELAGFFESVRTGHPPTPEGAGA